MSGGGGKDFGRMPGGNFIPQGRFRIKSKKISSIYNEYGLGSGINNLYEKVSRRYLNITLKECCNSMILFRLCYDSIQPHTRHIIGLKVFFTGNHGHRMQL